MNSPTSSGEAPQGARPLGPSLSLMQLGFRRSETTWVFCQQEFLETWASLDVILVQGPPTSIVGGENIFQGYSNCQSPWSGPRVGASSHCVSKFPLCEVEMFHWQKILQRERLNNGFFKYLR